MNRRSQESKPEREPQARSDGGLKSPAPVAIVRATPADVPAIAELLRDAGLADDGVMQHVDHFVVACDERGYVAAAGAEVHAPDALLRSVVVAEARRGAGIGDALVGEMETAAAGWGVERWWLLTSTAEKFFAARGFVRVPRADAPPSIQRSRQFSGGCCRSAVCMMRERKRGT
jgi:amino-acid N-acetyltransferase